MIKLLPLTLALLLGACTTNNESDDRTVSNNPFFNVSTLDLNYPEFDQIESPHYLPAFEKGMQVQLAEVDAIVKQSAAPSFANTMLPLEQSGQLFNRVATVFFAMSSAHTNEGINAIEEEIAPKLSEHSDKILLNSALFLRIKTLYQQKDSLDLDAESVRLIEENYKDFIRAGAELEEADKAHLRVINTEMAELETRFSQNVLSEVNASAIVVDSKVELAGLSEAEIEAAADEAQARNLPGKFVIPLLNTSGQPVLAALS